MASSQAAPSSTATASTHSAASSGRSRTPERPAPSTSPPVVSFSSCGTATRTGTITPTWPEVSAPTSSARGAEPPDDRRLLLRDGGRAGRADRRAQLLDVGRGERHELDLALLAAAGRLHVHALHAEQALDRPAHGVDGLHAPERDVHDLLREHPGPEPHRLPGERPGRRRPRHDPGDRRADRADGREAERAHDRVGVHPPAGDGHDADDQHRQRGVAQRVDGQDEDPCRVQLPRRGVHGPRLRAHPPCA